MTNHIENNLSEVSNDKLLEWEKYSDYMLQKISNLKKKIKDEQSNRTK